MKTLTMRDFVAIVFRRQRLILVSFFGLCGLAILLLSFVPNTYDAEMKILVKQSRVDPPVTPDQGQTQRVGNLTEQDLESEAELLRSRDVLEGAVAQCTMPKPPANLWSFVPVVNAFAAPPAPRQATDLLMVTKAARDLAENMQITTLKNSDVISIIYSSANPARAACILRSIGQLYMDKHLAVRRPDGAFEFFKQEADRYKQELQGIETQLASFGQEEQLVTDGTEKEIGVRKLSDYKAALVDTKTAIAETQARIRQLEKLSKTTAHRTVRSVRTAPNEALKDLQTQLVTLQVKRTEMESKFAPTYRPLLDLDKQIEAVKKAIQEAQQTPMVEQTTDTNPADDWITVEMAKARSELASLQAGTNAKERAVQEYRSLVLDLDQKNIRRSDLLRAQKTAEEKYLLYQRKQEEARIEQELDKQRILNVAIAEEPAVPVLPEPAPVPFKFGVVLAGLLSLGIGFINDVYDRSFRTPVEVEEHLGIPVLASTPLIGDASSQRETTAL
jgi:uncharacterized protein involved in exopolysaccharide biosynthesis